MVEVDGRQPIIFDMGTGLRFFGLTRPVDEPFHGTALLTHLHWDHVQGIPFFTPLLREGSHLDVYGPPQEGSSLEGAIRSFIGPPYFPVGIDDLPGSLEFHELLVDTIDIEGITVRSVPVPHTGLTLGFRVEFEGRSVVYVTDHQQPDIDSTYVDPDVLDLCRNADVLIHDAQFTRPEFEAKSTWGHCTYEYAVEVAAQSGARTLVLFHHDPEHADAELRRIEAISADLGARRGLQRVVAAAEGMSIDVSRESEQESVAG